MLTKMLLTTVFLLMFLPVQSVSADSVSEKLVKKAFSDYRKALKKEDYKKVWNSYSRNYQSNNFNRSYDNFAKSIDKDSRKLFGNMKVKDTNSTKDKITLITKPGGIYSRFTKTKINVEFIREDGTWKINDLNKSIFSRIPRRGYRPEDFSGLDDKTKSEIEAIQQLCSIYTKSLSHQDFRTAWKCLWKKRSPFEKFLKYGYVKGIKKKDSVRKSWASLIVLDIKIENDNATVDIGRDRASDNKFIFLLTKENNQWKIITWHDTSSLGFDEDKLPSFYFEQYSNQVSSSQ